MCWHMQFVVSVSKPAANSMPSLVAVYSYTICKWQGFLEQLGSVLLFDNALPLVVCHDKTRWFMRMSLCVWNRSSFTHHGEICEAIVCFNVLLIARYQLVQKMLLRFERLSWSTSTPALIDHVMNHCYWCKVSIILLLNDELSTWDSKCILCTITALMQEAETCNEMHHVAQPLVQCCMVEITLYDVMGNVFFANWLEERVSEFLTNQDWHGIQHRWDGLGRLWCWQELRHSSHQKYVCCWAWISHRLLC